jgi:hypothetical protein
LTTPHQHPRLGDIWNLKGGVMDGPKPGERNFLGEVALTCGLVLAGLVEGGAPPGQGLMIEVWWLNPG